MKENFLSVVIALVLASVIFFGLLINFDSFDKLQTNVIGSEQDQLLWDIVIETYKDKLEVQANKKIDDVVAVSVMILRNSNEVTPNFTTMESDWNPEVTDEFESRVTVYVNQLGGLTKWDTLLSIPLEGDVAQVTVSNAVLLFADESSELASLSTR